MKSLFAAVVLFLTSRSTIGATEAAPAEAAIEPLGTFYVVCIGLVFVGVLAGFYLYYMRWDEEDDKPD